MDLKPHNATGPNSILNLNSLLVKRQIDNGCDWGKLVPSSHKRGELRHATTRQFRERNQGFREVSPVPDSLGEEAILIDISRLLKIFADE